MIEFLVNYIKLRSRIVAGYLFAGLVSLIIIALSYLGLSQSSSNFSRFVSLEEQSRSELQLVSTLREIQRLALIYTHEGHGGAALQVDEMSRALLSQIEDLQSSDEPIIQSIHSEIREHLSVYISTFQQVKIERERQLQLVDVDFRNQANLVEDLLAQLLLTPDLGLESRLQLQSIMSSTLLVEKNAFRYFDSLDAGFVNATENSIDLARIGLEGILERDDIQAHGLEISEIRESLDLYEINFIEAVQRTRGYLYLINVVMAAEAYEILYQAGTLSAFLDLSSTLVTPP